ncbi:MAG: hypothetical protein JXR88_04255 [Clostridia bacterium]|nr:hypothetical protein [Clostridia bacterium]
MKKGIAIFLVSLCVFSNIFFASETHNNHHLNSIQLAGNEDFDPMPLSPMPLEITSGFLIAEEEDFDPMFF